ncbi:MAG: amidohydrolase family protein [Fimbriimonadaceae bacterium]|nr:amidohydrolase family protein [Fimbriimonadaceae bacterium]
MDFIKVNFNDGWPDVLKAATDEAHGLGLRALGHWAANLPIQRVVELGQDGVEHAEDRTESERLYRRMAAKGVWFTPTLAIERHLGLELGTRDFSSDPRQKYIVPAIWGSWNPQLGRRRPVEPRRRELFAERVRRGEQTTLAAYRAGGPMLAGSDCGANNSYMFCGWSIHEELQALVKAVLAPAEVLRMVTVNVARWRAAAGREGSV